MVYLLAAEDDTAFDHIPRLHFERWVHEKDLTHACGIAAMERRGGDGGGIERMREMVARERRMRAIESSHSEPPLAGPSGWSKWAPW